MKGRRVGKDQERQTRQTGREIYCDVRKKKKNHLATIYLRARHDQPIDQAGPTWPPVYPEAEAKAVCWKDWRSLGLPQLPGSPFPVYGMLPTANGQVGC